MIALAAGILDTMGDHGPSIKRDDVYEALRRKGYTKTKAARISNAVANGTNGHGVRGKAGGRSTSGRSGGRRSSVAARAGRRGTASRATSRGTKGRGRKR